MKCSKSSTKNSTRLDLRQHLRVGKARVGAQFLGARLEILIVVVAEEPAGEMVVQPRRARRVVAAACHQHGVDRPGRPWGWLGREQVLVEVRQQIAPERSWGCSRASGAA